jgi:hypothetical protein
MDSESLSSLQKKRQFWTDEVRLRATGAGGAHVTRISGGQVAHMLLRALVARTPQEDARLVQLVAIHGMHNWPDVAVGLRGRDGKSCSLRCARRCVSAAKRHRGL